MYQPFEHFYPVRIGEHTVQVPHAPTRPLSYTGDSGTEHTIPLDELILNHDLPYDNAYWSRVLLPRFFYAYIPATVDAKGDIHGTQLFAEETLWEGSSLISLNQADSEQLIYLYDREMHRRRHGVHFKNGNDIVYITGDHYFVLQWLKMYGINPKMLPAWRPMDYEYGEYRDFQRDIFYLIKFVNEDPDRLGLFIAKPKKTGVTQILAGYFLNKGTMTRMAQMGVMSKGNDASSVNMLMIIHGFDGLPPIFQPNIKNRADKEGDLFFGEPALRNVSTKAGKARRQKIMDSKPLNTRIWAAKTKAAGFDSPTMADVWFDEFPKYDTENKQNVENIFTRNQETVKLQDIYNGRIWITSYPPEDDTQGFRDARTIYYNSKLSTIPQGENRTKTGLITHYVSTILSYNSAFDKYGRCDEKLAHQRNQAERQKVANDKKAYQAKVRQYSENERECWASSGSGSTFDAIRLGELMLNLEEQFRSGARFWEEGQLEWDNALWESGAKDKRPAKHFTSVRWVPLTDQQIREGKKGKMRLYQLPAKAERNRALRMGYDEKGNLRGLPGSAYYGAADPTDYAGGTEVVKGSKNANYTMNFADPVVDAQYGRIASNTLISEYFHRPDNPEEYYQDTVKEIIFFGKTVIAEANKAWVATRLIEDGLGYYMLVKNKDTGLIERWKPNMNYGLIQ
jgi:hypothetical protein